MQPFDQVSKKVIGRAEELKLFDNLGSYKIREPCHYNAQIAHPVPVSGGSILERILQSSSAFTRAELVDERLRSSEL